MSESAQDDDIDVEDALAQLLEIQRKIDDRARRTVDRIKRLLDQREVLVPGVEEVFAKQHGAWYDATERDLVAEGFRVLGDYQPNDHGDKPPEKRPFYRFGLSADRTIVATWFLFPSEKPLHCIVLESSFSDGATHATTRGIRGSGLPVPPNETRREMASDTSIHGLISAQRDEITRHVTPPIAFEGIDAILAERDREAREVAEFRRGIGLGLFEPYLRKVYGDRFDDEGAPLLESIEAHPEWWTGEAAEGPTSSGMPFVDANQPLHLMFLMSRDVNTERGHLTTFGLAFRGLPEMQMKELAPNHCRAARFLLAAAARSLLAHATRLPPGDRTLAQRLSGIDLEIAPIHVQPSPVLRGGEDTEPSGSATVRIELEPFDSNGATVADIFSALFTTKRAAPLLRVKPSGDSVEMADEWLRRTCRRLGLAAPAAQPIAALDSAMAEASRRAVQGLPRIRQRLEAGLPDGQICVIKVGLETTHGDKEFVWVRVTEWSSDAFVGALEVQPNDCPGYTLGQTMRVADANVFDCAIVNPSTGPVEPALTDVVAQDFGVDLPG